MKLDSICRHCRKVTVTVHSDFQKASPPRCNFCGGMLDRGKAHCEPPARIQPTRRKRNRKKLKGVKLETRLAVECVVRRAATEGLEADFRVPVCNGKEFVHVMLSDGKQRLLDWWPTTGAVMVDGVKQRAESPDAVLSLAKAEARRRVHSP